MKTYWTADDHFYHERILEITDRDLVYGSIEEHNDGLLEEINSTVGEQDRLIVLGDWAWRAGESIMARIRCKNLHLIFGNHDRVGFGKLFKSVEDTSIVKIQGHKVFNSHYPHCYWPSSHRGSIHLYGHVHAEREETLDAVFPGRRSMDAGVDNAKLLLGKHRPFSEDEILEIMLPRPGHDLVEWYDQQRAKRRDKRLVRGTGVAPPLGTITIPPGPEHVCGQAGYDGMRDPPCPGCEHRQQSYEAQRAPSAKDVAAKLHERFLRNGQYGQ